MRLVKSWFFYICEIWKFCRPIRYIFQTNKEEIRVNFDDNLWAINDLTFKPNHENKYNYY